jgi:hypothetical protein
LTRAKRDAADEGSAVAARIITMAGKRIILEGTMDHGARDVDSGSLSIIELEGLLETARVAAA